MMNIFDRSPDIKSTNSFKSYVSVDDLGINVPLSEMKIKKKQSAITPTLLPGELLVQQADNVLMFSNVSERNQGLCGKLYVTSFRLSFLATDDKSTEDNFHQHNNYLGDFDVCLTNICSILQILPADKRRKLLPATQMPNKVKGLQIICKNMKMLTFSFELCKGDSGKNICVALLHHVFVKRHSLLFAYDYKETITSSDTNTIMFNNHEDWNRELDRAWPNGRTKWRVSSANSDFDFSLTLPKYIIVPQSVLDCDLIEAARYFRCNRPPIWSWCTSTGAAIVRMAEMLPTITDSTKENTMLETIRKAHPKLKVTALLDLARELPTVKDINTSYVKLRELCTPETLKHFQEHDGRFYASLDSSKWLHYVSMCLKKSCRAANKLLNDTTVVLQECDGRDTSALISSLTQLLLDPHTRTIIGFQSLIQKEWIALGHPFCKRLGHVFTSESEQGPVFLLFLDCVWQLQKQYPTHFEFTETYLTTLWDSCHLSILDTFLFDCERERFAAKQEYKMVLRNVWNWDLQFNEQEIELFRNPLFKIKQLLPKVNNQRNSYHLGLDSKDKDNNDKYITPSFNLPNIEVWTQCYYRWLPWLGIKCGGYPQIELRNRQLMNEIKLLTNEEQDVGGEFNYIDNIDNCDSFYPFTHGRGLNNTIVMASSSFISSDLDTQSVLNYTE